jgi:hypothetical protein
VRAIGVKPFENLVANFGPHARSVIINQNLDVMAQVPTGHANRAAWRRE